MVKEYKRRYGRFSAERGAKTLLAGWEDCTIIDISRKGMCIKFLPREIITVGTTIYTEIFIPNEITPVSIKGTLKWIKKDGSHCVGGIELPVELDDHNWIKLRS